MNRNRSSRLGVIQSSQYQSYIGDTTPLQHNNNSNIHPNQNRNRLNDHNNQIRHIYNNNVIQDQQQYQLNQLNQLNQHASPAPNNNGPNSNGPNNNSPNNGVPNNGVALPLPPQMMAPMSPSKPPITWRLRERMKTGKEERRMGRRMERSDSKRKMPSVAHPQQHTAHHYN